MLTRTGRSKRLWTVAVLLAVGLLLRGQPALAQEPEWTWQSPLPLSAVWGSSDSDIYAVGAFGTMLHYDGSGWSSVDSGTSSGSLYGVWGSSSSDVYVVGEFGIILHYDGSSWSGMYSGTLGDLFAVWGSSGSDIFAVGWFGVLTHYDGSGWSSMSSGTDQWLYGVWGSSGSDVFAVGDSGTILHYDGSVWSAMSSGTTEGLSGVWGSSSSDVYVVGGSGTILHYDGSVWSAMSSGTSNNLSAVWGSSGADPGPPDIYVVGWYGTILHYDGSAWSNIGSGTDSWSGVWGSSSSDIYIVSDEDTILHYTPPPQLSILKDVAPADPVPYRGAILYTVLLDNQGRGDAEGTAFTDTLPGAVDFGLWIERPNGASISGDQITWNGTVGTGQAITFTFVVHHVGRYGDVVTNTAHYLHAGERGSDEATFTVEAGFDAFLPLVMRHLTP